MPIPVKSADELARMRDSGGIAARVLAAVAKDVRPGVTIRELNEVAREAIEREGAVSAFLGYRGFPGQICVSVNDEVVHGMPRDLRIAIGDIVSLDCGVVYRGWYGDNARTVAVGVSDPEALRLIRVTEDALEAGVAAAVAGRRLGDVGHAVQTVVEAAGFSVVREFVGHGIGRALHEEPQIPNFGPAGRGPILKAGMTLAIEPMVNQRGLEVQVDPDGWTVRARDGGLSSHAEVTVAVGPDSAEVLTKV